MLACRQVAQRVRVADQRAQRAEIFRRRRVETRRRACVVATELAEVASGGWRVAELTSVLAAGGRAVNHVTVDSQRTGRWEPEDVAVSGVLWRELGSEHAARCGRDGEDEAGLLIQVRAASRGSVRSVENTRVDQPVT